MERHSLRIVSGKSPKTMRKLCLSIKFPNHKFGEITVFYAVYISSDKKDFEIRKAQVWVACNKLHTMWNSGISNKTKINLFKTCFENILLYGSGKSTISKQLEKRLDGTYTRLLMRAQKINWKQHFTPEQIYKTPQRSQISLG